MVHLIFLLVGLGLAVVGQLLLLASLQKVANWWLRRNLQLLGLCMPASVLVIFGYAMLPDLLSNHAAMQMSSAERFISLLSFGLASLPLLLVFIWNLARTGGLYWQVGRFTWAAPTGLAALINTLNLPPNLNPEKICLKLWLSSTPFAFNLPSCWPGGAAQIVVSTQMVTQLTEQELKAVLAHELAHLSRHDFQVSWLASWLKDAFTYLPTGKQFLRLLHTDKELACDEQVAQRSGLTGTLALTEALLKVWEHLLENCAATSRKKSFLAGAGYFEAPGFISTSLPKHTAQPAVAELRVARLLELSESGKLYQTVKPGFRKKLEAGSLLSGSVGLWFIVLEVIHLIMLPLGCAISGSFFQM